MKTSDFKGYMMQRVGDNGRLTKRLPGTSTNAEVMPVLTQIKHEQVHC